MNNLKTNRFIHYASSFLSVLLLSACIEQPSEPMNIASNNWLGYKPLYLAERLDLINPSEIHLTELTSNSEVMRLFRNNVIDGAALTLDEALLLKQDGIDIEIVLVMDVSDGADVIISHDDIFDMEALRGKRVGVEKTALGAYMLTRALTLYKLKRNQITWVSYEYSEHESAFINKEIDAVVTFEPTRSRLLKHGGHIIFDSSQIKDEIIDVFVVRRSYLDKHGDKVKNLISAWFLALEYYKKNSDKSVEILAPMSDLSIEQYHTAVKNIRHPDYTENVRLFNHSDNTLKENTARLAKVMQENKLLNNKINIIDLFDNRPLLDLSKDTKLLLHTSSQQ